MFLVKICYALLSLWILTTFNNLYWFDASKAFIVSQKFFYSLLSKRIDFFLDLLYCLTLHIVDQPFMLYEGEEGDIPLTHPRLEFHQFSLRCVGCYDSLPPSRWTGSNIIGEKILLLQHSNHIPRERWNLCHWATTSYIDNLSSFKKRYVGECSHSWNEVYYAFLTKVRSPKTFRATDFLFAII